MQEQDKKVQEFQAQNEKRQAEERGKLLDSIQTATNNLAKTKVILMCLMQIQSYLR